MYMVIGLNAALQKTILLNHFKVNEVNRASEVKLGVGGKGQQTAKALNNICPGSVLLYQFLGGESGVFIHNYLSKLGISQMTVNVPEPTRTCTTLICAHTAQVTEIIEPSATIPPLQSQQLLDLIEEKISTVKGMAICGTYPPGITQQYLLNIIQRKPSQAVLLLDGYQGVDFILKSGKVDILKINEKELLALSQANDITTGANHLIKTYNIQLLGVTAGPADAHLFTAKGEHFLYKIPPLPIKNPIGAGDTVSALFLHLICDKKLPSEAFKYALAGATASCAGNEGGIFPIDQMHAIASQISVTSQ
uniref:Carbohydrate kinase PfkB domain-containing protein n=1 Tax=Arcella intermedia TaxID=1963864 RepID=A0A6B2LAY8_9EUKA|eukprot:TRINITY_DN6840_c0_g1_i1.p1 TRINITY_DN6840_c0_g1~~TRINITY_DN6840_c0_g1_i1.p1  ORF type:complete len:307 (-),score=84.47 TRINITY_DN6840_c0_g1_i1:153-1073(-)